MTDVLAEKLGGETAAMAQALEQGSFAPALKDNHDLIHKIVGQNFANASSPDGGAWAPRKAKTGDLTKNGVPWQHPLLILSGDLFQAATSDFGAGHIEQIGDRDAFTGIDPDEIPYAATHNFGDKEREPIMPQREFEDVDEATLDRMAERIADRGIELLL